MQTFFKKKKKKKHNQQNVNINVNLYFVNDICVAEISAGKMANHQDLACPHSSLIYLVTCTFMQDTGFIY